MQFIYSWPQLLGEMLMMTKTLRIKIKIKI
ncbi:hypothetical protein KR49_06450 [Synechococcus sp. KORDI-49]|nr:hypothetical protein KR49_06450 [Synechococcus sp. KORDI-49]